MCNYNRTFNETRFKQMTNLNIYSDITIIRAIENHETILWQIQEGKIWETAYTQGLLEKELAEMQAELTCRHTDAEYEKNRIQGLLEKELAEMQAVMTDTYTDKV